MSRKALKKKPVAKKTAKSRRGIVVFALILVVAAAVAAYVLSQPPRQAGSSGEIAPDFTLPVVTSSGLSEETVRLSSSRGKVVVLEFMVSWCTVCRQMSSSIEHLNERYQGQDVVFLSVAGTQRGASAESTAEFIREYHVTWTHVLDDENAVFSQYGVEATPTYLIIDRDGRVLSKFQGAVSTDAIARAIDLALS